MSRVDFQRNVLERSDSVPVVVDFWAPWCAPCRTLGPVIERLAAEAGGRWELVKLNTEEQPEIARDHGIRGIPAVKMFYRGKVAGEFVGALPEERIRDWLAAHLPDSLSRRLEDLVEGWQTRGFAEILPGLEAFVEENPDHVPGRLRLAQALVVSDPARARDLVPDSELPVELSDLAADVTSLADLMQVEGAPERLAARLDGAREAMRRHDLAAVLEHLVEAAMVDKRFGDELARRAAVALFRMLGHDHDLTREYRSRLSMAIHS